MTLTTLPPAVNDPYLADHGIIPPRLTRHSRDHCRQEYRDRLPGRSALGGGDWGLGFLFVLSLMEISIELVGDNLRLVLFS